MGGRVEREEPSNEQTEREEREKKRGKSTAHSTLQPQVFGRPRRVCGQVTVETEHYGTSLW